MGGKGEDGAGKTFSHCLGRLFVADECALFLQNEACSKEQFPEHGLQE